MNCSVCGAFSCESNYPSEELPKRVRSLCLFLGGLKGSFSGASKLLDPESFLRAIGCLASELSEIEVLSLLLSTRR